ncbi:hypothetical protein [Nonomuraea recticatena]|uniref:hypothetical protein n=1 Tax=Nonomuraea recticatena TaxID=46178 RepID=UPI0036118BF7
MRRSTSSRRWGTWMKTSWRSRPPVAMDRLIRQRLEETSHELHRLNSLWGLLAHPQAGVAESMERIEGVDAVNRRIQAFRARSTVQTLKTAPKAGRGSPRVATMPGWRIVIAPAA